MKGIVGKLTQGAVDAGFVYVTDVDAAGDELEAIALPPVIEPDVTYAAGVVRRRAAAGPRAGIRGRAARGRLRRRARAKPASGGPHERLVPGRAWRWRSRSRSSS